MVILYPSLIEFPNFLPKSSKVQDLGLVSPDGTFLNCFSAVSLILDLQVPKRTFNRVECVKLAISKETIDMWPSFFFMARLHMCDSLDLIAEYNVMSGKNSSTKQ